MKRFALLLAVTTLAVIVASAVPASGYAGEEAAPVFGIKIPPGYRDWKLISVAHEVGTLNDNVQFMVKDSSQYASTGGWGFAQFKNGKSDADATTLKKCFPCHVPVQARDYVFTRYAPAP